MNIILGKDGKLSVNNCPLQGKEANLDNLAAFISDPQDGNAIVYNATKGVWEAGEVSGGGGSGGGMVVKVTVGEAGMVMDHTWKEIYDALPVTPVTIMIDMNGTRIQGNVVSISPGEGAYSVIAVIYTNGEYNDTEFVTDSEDGYPTSQA